MNKTLKLLAWAFFALGGVLCFVAAALMSFLMVWLILGCWAVTAILYGIAFAHDTTVRLEREAAEYEKQKAAAEKKKAIEVDADTGEVFSPKGHQGSVKFR